MRCKTVAGGSLRQFTKQVHFRMSAPHRELHGWGWAFQAIGPLSEACFSFPWYSLDTSLTSSAHGRCWRGPAGHWRSTAGLRETWVPIPLCSGGCALRHPAELWQTSVSSSVNPSSGEQGLLGPPLDLKVSKSFSPQGGVLRSSPSGFHGSIGSNDSRFLNRFRERQ